MQYVILDVEMCKIPKALRTKKYRHANEIIQLGAVLVDEDYNIVDSFDEYVKPQLGTLDKKIIDLTGITYENIKDADSFNAVMHRFENWLIDKEVTAVSWSMTDMTQMLYEAEVKEYDGYIVDRLCENWIDCQEMFDKKIDADRQMSLRDAIVASDIEVEGREHDGLVDAMNTAKLFIKLMLNPDYRLNDYYYSARYEEPEPMNFSIGALFAGLDLKSLPA